MMQLDAWSTTFCAALQLCGRPWRFVTMRTNQNWQARLLKLADPLYITFRILYVPVLIRLTQLNFFFCMGWVNILPKQCRNLPQNKIQLSKYYRGSSRIWWILEYLFDWCLLWPCQLWPWTTSMVTISWLVHSSLSKPRAHGKRSRHGTFGSNQIGIKWFSNLYWPTYQDR